MVQSWRRRQASTVQVVRGADGLTIVRPDVVSATPERVARGDLQAVTLFDEVGRPVVVQRATSIAERLAQIGELGDEVVRLLAAAEWFGELGTVAQLRGRLIQSQLAHARGTMGEPIEAFRAARLELAHVYDVLGADAFNVLYDVLIWDMEPRGADRRALFRAALYVLARWRGVSSTKKTPATSRKAT